MASRHFGGFSSPRPFGPWAAAVVVGVSVASLAAVAATLSSAEDSSAELRVAAPAAREATLTPTTTAAAQGPKGG